jgi:hypothetical protein
VAQLDVRRLYASGVAPTKEQLDAFVDDIETFINLTKLNDDNIQDAGIDATTKIIDGTVTTAKFKNSAVTTAKIADSAILTAALAPLGIESASIANLAVTTAKIADSAITTAKINDTAVTKIKAADNYTLSSAISFTDTYNAFRAYYTPVDKSISVTITTSGNPVLVTLIPTSSAGEFATTYTTGVPPIATIFFYRDSTVVSYQYANNYSGRGPGGGSYFVIDTPAAGTYTYKLMYGIQGADGGFTSTASLSGKLLAMELY